MEATRIKRELLQKVHLSKHSAELNAFCDLRNNRQAPLCGESMSQYRNNIRILKDRRRK